MTAKTPSLSALNARRFGRLSVVGLVLDKSGHPVWRCLCDCGGYTTVTAGNLNAGHVQSCGCLRRKAPPPDPRPCYTELQACWKDMKAQCTVRTHWAWRFVGARRIRVCNRWKNNFKAFYRWSLANRYTSGAILKRRNQSLGFMPVNCYWALPLPDNYRRPL